MFNFNRSKSLCAGLVLRKGTARYGELRRAPSGQGFVICSAQEIPLPEGSVNEKIRDGALTGRYLRSKLSRTRGIPFYLALPAQDCLLKTIELPDMDLEDARSALFWNFESYFPYQREKTTFDVIAVTVPGEPGGEKNYLAAAVMTDKILPLLDGLTVNRDFVSAVEPVSLSICRALTGLDEGGFSLLAFIDEGQFYTILRYQGQGIFFRASDFPNWNSLSETEQKNRLADELGRTLDFIGSKYGPTPISSVRVAGMDHRDQRDQLKESLRDYGVRICWTDLPQCWPIDFSPPADSTWIDLAGLLLRHKDYGAL